MMKQTSDSKVILIVDDEIHIVNVLAMRFRQAGWQVLTAGNLADALEIVQLQRPDLVIADYQMPGGSGVELCTRLRASPDTSDVPVILLTADAFLLEQEQLDGCDVRAIVSKPFSPRELVVRANRILETHSRCELK